MQLLEFASLSRIAGLRHALTTRDGGVSTGSYAALNLAFHVGDEVEAVRENRRLLAQEMGITTEALTCAQQVHGDKIQIATIADRGRGASGWDDAIPGTDALITAGKEIPLLILVADCAPILLADPEKRVLALVHAGWRGALAGIAGKTVARMQQDFGCHLGAILTGIGPCLNVENLEVGPEVAAEIEKVDAQAVISGWEKPHLDLRGLIQRDLERSGVYSTNIETMDISQKDDTERFFSHRGQNGVAGRFGIVAWWE